MGKESASSAGRWIFNFFTEEPPQAEQIAIRHFAVITTEIQSNNWDINKTLHTFDQICRDNDAALLQAMRVEYGKFLTWYCHQLSEAKQSVSAESGATTDHYEKYLNPCLCLLPFICNASSRQEIYEIPCKFPMESSSGSIWKQIPYKVKAIELTPTVGFGRLSTSESGRVFAYGLSVQNNDQFSEIKVLPESHLIFKSPPYWGAERWFTHLNWFTAPGSLLLYGIGQKRIQAWVSQQTDNKVIVHGMGWGYLQASAAVVGNSNIMLMNVDTAQMPAVATQAGINALHYLVYGLFILPCQYLLIPCIRAVFHHKTEVAAIAILTFGFMLFPELLAAPMGIAALTIASAFLAYQCIDPLTRFLGIKPPQPPENEVWAESVFRA